MRAQSLNNVLFAPQTGKCTICSFKIAGDWKHHPYGSLCVCSWVYMCTEVCSQAPMYAFAVNIAIQGERGVRFVHRQGARDEQNKRDAPLFAPRVCTFTLSLGDAVVYYDFQKAGRASTGQTRRRRIKQQSVTSLTQWDARRALIPAVWPFKDGCRFEKEFSKRDACRLFGGNVAHPMRKSG